MKKVFTTGGTERTEKNLLKNSSVAVEAASGDSTSDRICRRVLSLKKTDRAIPLFEKVFSVRSVSSVVNASSGLATLHGVRHQERTPCS